MDKFIIYQNGNSFFSNKEKAFNLSSQSSFGETKSGKVLYSIYEVLYLLDSGKAELIKGSKTLKFNELIKKANHDAYLVFKDLRDKGNIPKEGLKFGADFRIYEKGSKPGKAHAKYLLYIIRGKIDLKTFSAKARVAHSTNKILLMAIIDSEEDITYYEVKWKN